jgi:hypothetical protein
MVLECPKCNRKFTILDSLEKLRQTCSNEKCKCLISILKLETNERSQITIYEIGESKEDIKPWYLDACDC